LQDRPGILQRAMLLAKPFPIGFQAVFFMKQQFDS